MTVSDAGNGDQAHGICGSENFGTELRVDVTDEGIVAEPIAYRGDFIAGMGVLQPYVLSSQKQECLSKYGHKPGQCDVEPAGDFRWVQPSRVVLGP